MFEVHSAQLSCKPWPGTSLGAARLERQPGVCAADPAVAMATRPAPAGPGQQGREEGGYGSAEVPSSYRTDGGYRGINRRRGNSEARPQRREERGRGRGMRARKSPPPACRAAETEAARKDLKPFGGGVGGGQPESLRVGAPGSCLSDFPSPAPIPGFSGGISPGEAVAPPVRAGARRGVAPQAPGGFSRPEGRAQRSGVSARTSGASLAE